MSHTFKFIMCYIHYTEHYKIYMHVMFCLWYEHEHRYEVIVLFISSNRESWSLSWSVLTSVATTRRDRSNSAFIDISQILENLFFTLYPEGHHSLVAVGHCFWAHNVCCLSNVWYVGTYVLTVSATWAVCFCDWLSWLTWVPVDQSQAADSLGRWHSTYVAQTQNIVGNNVFWLQSCPWSVWWAGLWEMVSTRSCVNQTSISPHPRWSDNTSAVKPAQPTPIKPECSQNTFYSEIAHNESLAELFKIFTLQICLE